MKILFRRIRVVPIALAIGLSIVTSTPQMALADSEAIGDKTDEEVNRASPVTAGGLRQAVLSHLHVIEPEGDPSKILTPNTVLPDGDKRIRIEIHLEGVEEQP